MALITLFSSYWEFFTRFSDTLTSDLDQTRPGLLVNTPMVSIWNSWGEVCFIVEISAEQTRMTRQHLIHSFFSVTVLLLSSATELILNWTFFNMKILKMWLHHRQQLFQAWRSFGNENIYTECKRFEPPLISLFIDSTIRSSAINYFIKQVFHQ